MLWFRRVAGSSFGVVSVSCRLSVGKEAGAQFLPCYSSLPIWLVRYMIVFQRHGPRRKEVETVLQTQECLRLVLDGCQSGRLGTPGKRVYRKVPRVRIPPHPKELYIHSDRSNMLPYMRWQRSWFLLLLALAGALVLTSCINQEGVGAGEGELQSQTEKSTGGY
jgi:hypothetical protein